MMGGESSALRFYSITNTNRAVGFFANANHNAAFLYCTIPLAAAIGSGFRRRLFNRIFIGALLLGFIIIGLALTLSRAGLMLAIIAGFICLPLVLSNRRTKDFSRGRLVGIVGGGGVIALLIAFQFGFVSMAERLQDQGLEDLRWPVALVTLKAAQANLPFGTGFGTFVPVYQTVEPRTLLDPRYVNRAHNDWLEAALEGGILTMIGFIAFLGWFGHSCFRTWRSNPNGNDTLNAPLARAGSIVIVLLILHSIVDYPLRTTAMSVVFALACALLIDLKDPTVRPTRVAKPIPIDGERNSVALPGR
jgi:O-antigen ligase